MSKLGFVSVVWMIIAALWTLAAPAAEKGGRTYVSGNSFLSIGGAPAGFVKSVDGGGIAAEVINEPAGPSYLVKKHLGQPKYEDLVILLGFSNTGSVYEWISASWQMKGQPKDLLVTACDYSFKPISERQYVQALIAETTVPAMDASSKEPGYLTLRISPETSRSVTPASGAVKAESSSEPKVWLPMNFRLEIAGLDCTKVSRIEPFSVKQVMTTDNIGDARDYLKEPGKLQFPNLQITLSEVSAGSWTNWFENFVVKGNNDESNEKNGTLILLSADRTTELARISFFNMGIFRLTPAKREAGDTVARVTVELYVERMEFAIGKGGMGTTPGPATRLRKG